MNRTVRIAIIFAVEAAAVLFMVGLYARDLHGGREIILETEPVDPRSLFRGHYVRLGYAVSALDPALTGETCYRRGDAVFVTLEQSNDDWKAVAAAGEKPARETGENRVVLRGRAVWTHGCGDTRPPPREAAPLRVEYGIEAYFAAPETAQRLEDRARDAEEALSVIVSVPASGRALIKGLVIDGEKIYDQTLW